MPILETCDRDTGYEGGRKQREPWWRQTAAQKQISSTLEEILAEARALCWESGWHGEVGGVRELAESDTGSNYPRYSETETCDARVGE